MAYQERHIGLYGIYVQEEKLLVVKKTRGPYTSRYDLPGGGLELGESLTQCLLRELQEEIGGDFYIDHQYGAYDFYVRYLKHQKDFTLHHVAIMYHVTPALPLEASNIVSSDTNGFSYIPIRQLNIRNASPLVLKALELINDKENINPTYFENWQVLEAKM